MQCMLTIIQVKQFTSFSCVLYEVRPSKEMNVIDTKIATCPNAMVRLYLYVRRVVQYK